MTGLSPAWQGHLAMLGFAMCVSGSFSLGAQVAHAMDPAAMTAVRFVIAALAMWALALGSGAVTQQVFRAPWRYLVLAALYAIYFTTMFEALKTADPVSLAAVFTLNPGLTALFGYLVMTQLTTPRMALAIGVGALGTLWVIFRGDLEALLGFDLGRGEVVFLWGCAAHALFTPVLRRLSRGEPALAFTAMILTSGAAILILWSLPELIAVDWSGVSAFVWWVIVYLALVATGMTFLILRFATLRLPSAKVMAYTYLVPSCVILWEVALGRGVPDALVLPGVGLTVLSLALLLKDEPRAG